MISSTNGASQGGLLAASLSTITPSPTLSPSESFGQHLSAALARSLEQIGIDPRNIQVKIEESGRQPSGTKPGTRQFLVTFEAPPAVSALETPSEPALPQAAAQSPVAAEQTQADPLAVLRDALSKAGIDPNSMVLSESREAIGYPGGAYINHIITAELGGGRTENFGVELMLKNPWLTAFEIRKLMGMRA